MPYTSNGSVDWTPPDIEHQEQSVGVELRPVSGLLGKQDAIELTSRDKDAARHARRVRRERTGTRDPALLKDPNFRLLWLSTLFVGSWAMSGGKKADAQKGPPINASSKDEEDFVQYVRLRAPPRIFYSEACSQDLEEVMQREGIC